MHEVLLAAGFLWCAATYWIGGQAFPKRGYYWIRKESWEGDNTEGRKWIRRFVMPAGLLVILLVMGAPLIRALPACLLLCAGTHLGYKADLLRYLLAGAAMGAGALLIGIHWTAALPALFHTLGGAVSLKDNKFGWAIVALLTGGAIGIAYTVAV